MIQVYDTDEAREDIAAVASDSPEYQAIAEKIWAEVLTNAAAHIHSGDLFSAIELKQGKVDWRIQADGVTYSFHTEYGHFVYFDKEGRRCKQEEAVSKKWVEGIGVFRDVVAENGGF